MRIVAALAGAGLIALMLVEFFVAFMLPRRVKRDPRIARGLHAALWRPWRAVAARLSPSAEDTMLGLFGPLALLSELIVWALGIMLGFALLQWAFGSRVGSGRAFADDLYFSSGDFLTAATAYPVSRAARILGLLEAATGVAVLFSVIGYLPSIYGAFSRREVAVSQLGPRAGTPPSALHLLRRTAQGERWRELRDYLAEAEEWAAELMETHLSYPLLAYYRSQHVNQNWLAALTTIVDASAAVLAARPEGEALVAEQTYAIGRHALADLAHVFRARRESGERLDDDAFAHVREVFETHDYEIVAADEMRRRLDRLRDAYEPNAIGLSRALALPLPGWAPSETPLRAPHR